MAVDVLDIGPVHFPTGTIFACDPMVELEDALPFLSLIHICIWFLRSPQKSRRSNLPEGYHVRRTWYNVWKQTLYHSASGFRVHRENPGAQISRRGTMSEGHGIMKILCKWKRVLPWTDIADGFGLF